MKSKTFKLSIGVCLIILAMLIMVGFKGCIENMGTKNQTSPMDKVIVVTNKAEYVQGEEVKVSLDYDGDLYVWDYPWSSWSIQRRVGSLWIDLKLGLTPCIMECKDVPSDEVIDCIICQLEPPRWSLMKGSTITFTWDQRYISNEGRYQCRDYYTGKIIRGKCMNYQQVPPGEYKVRLEYALNIQNDMAREGVDVKYAEREFTIRKP
jgi:hypothetical protein